MWEDEANKNGGRWVLRVAKGYANKLWEDLILAFIGEQFTDENEICGIIVSVRNNGDQISIWNKHGKDKVIVERIKAELIQLLNLPENVKMDYNVHIEPEAVPVAPTPATTLQRYHPQPGIGQNISGGRGGSRGDHDGYRGGHGEGRG
jgi:hypothetical protein